MVVSQGIIQGDGKVTSTFGTFITRQLINGITPDILEKVIKNTVRKISMCLIIIENIQRISYLNYKTSRLSLISYLTNFYSCISCHVISVQNGEVTFAPPCICNHSRLFKQFYTHFIITS